MAPKRAHKTLTLAEKHDILQKLKSGVSGKVLATKYGVGTSTISDIKKKSQQITSYVENCFTVPGRKKTLRKGENPQMETELYQWFLEQREKHITITSDILREKAMQIYAKCCGDNNFSASRGWLSKFKKRHGIHFHKVCGEKLSNDSDAVKPFFQKLANKIREMQLQPNQLYNAGESALFWKLLPDRTLVNAKEKSDVKPGREISQERITFVPCANGDGSHKLKMLVIGKSKNIVFTKCSIPVEYHATKNACMTSSLFVKWFRESFVQQVKTFQKDNNMNGKALLLIDNAPSHATETQLISDDGNIVTMFLPSNCTPSIQPMDQNAIRLTKMYYRKNLLVHILSFEENDISNTVRNINLNDAVFLLASSWDKVSPDVIQRCWNKIFFHSDNDDSHSVWNSEDLIPLSLLNRSRESDSNEQREIMAEISNMLRIITAGNGVIESEINEWIDGDEEYLRLHGDENDSEEEVVRINQKVKHVEAIRCFSTCIQFVEENGSELNILSMLRTLRHRAMQANQCSIKQTKLTDFFKP